MSNQPGLETEVDECLMLMRWFYYEKGDAKMDTQFDKLEPELRKAEPALFQALDNMELSKKVFEECLNEMDRRIRAKED